MREILLTKGKVALVDDADYEYLSQFKWQAQARKCGIWYAYRTLPCSHSIIAMHRDILKTAKGLDTDHIDGNGLNNQRSNLRECTHAENIHNQKVRLCENKSSKFKGVRWDKDRNRWRVEIKLHGKAIYVGRFISELQAALSYNEAAKKYHGEFARLNTIEV